MRGDASSSVCIVGLTMPAVGCLLWYGCQPDLGVRGLNIVYKAAPESQKLEPHVNLERRCDLSLASLSGSAKLRSRGGQAYGVSDYQGMAAFFFQRVR